MQKNEIIDFHEDVLKLFSYAQLEIIYNDESSIVGMINGKCGHFYISRNNFCAEILCDTIWYTRAYSEAIQIIDAEKFWNFYLKSKAKPLACVTVNL